MIKFSSLENDLDEYRSQWKAAKPFSHLVADNFLEPEDAFNIQKEFPDPARSNLSHSRDYIFAKNKYEKSGFWEFGPSCQAFYQDLLNPRFATILQGICGHKVWIDQGFHGGGMHQGGVGSFLDMHTDFNLHPLHEDWFRDLNILFYLNPDWIEPWRGELRLRNKWTNEEVKVQPRFGRCVIMKTRDYTLHGYDPIDFPEGQYRRSVACYAYSALVGKVHARSTSWYPSGNNVAKKMAGRIVPHVIACKNRFWRSSTSRNR